MTLYEEALSSGLAIGHHLSDLYLAITPKALAIVEKHNRRTVLSKRDGAACLIVPFAYDPYWIGRNQRLTDQNPDY